jgi:acyl dehydratase
LLTKLSSENSIGVKGVVMGVNYGIDKLRFLAPVRAGKRIRAHTEVLSVDRKDANRFLVKTGVTVEIEGEETPALYAEWLGMQFIA